MRTRFLTALAALLALLLLSAPLAAAQDGGNVPILAGIRDRDVYLFGTGGEPVQVSQTDLNAVPYNLKWTPDGQHLLYEISVPETPGLSLMVTDAQGSAPTEIADNLIYMPVAFTDDSSVIYATPGEMGPAQGEGQVPQMSISVYRQPLSAGAEAQKIADIPFGTGCGGGSPFPMDSLYSMDAGFMGNDLTLHMTERGLLHSVSCIGVGVSLLNVDTGEETALGEDLARAAMSPDGTAFAAVRFQSFPDTAELVTVDLASLAVTPIETSAQPDQLTWGSDGAIYYSVREQRDEPLAITEEQMQLMTAAGRLGPDSKIPQYHVAVYRVDPETRQDTLIYEAQDVWAVGRLFTAGGALYFSVIPGAQTWIEGLLTTSVDMETAEGFMQEQRFVAPTLYRMPLTGGEPTAVLEDLTAATPQPGA